MEINERKLKGILKEQRREYQRYLGAAVEHFDSQVEVIAEQYIDIKETLKKSKALEKRVRLLESKIKS